MFSLIEENQDAIADLCRQYHVRRLELFGSAADGTFREDQSDVDFLIEFERPSPLSPFDQYFGLLLGLKRVLGHEVDLIEPANLTNPYMLRSVERSARQVVYDAA